jgi:CRISPR/Cas system-associated exonuclease Cas4 (RecB family)
VGIEKTPLGGSLFLSLEAIENEQAVYAMALDAMERMDVDVTTDDLKSILKALHALLFRRWEPIHNLHDFSQVLEELLDGLLHRSLIDKYPLNSKVVATMLTMAEEFDRASFKQEFFAQADIFKIFMDKLDHEMISFMGSPLKGLQILGLFETRSLCFENVIVLDANESILPTLKICEPLIPRDVMLGLGLNRLEKEEEIQRYQFMRLLAAASHVHLFYQETAEKEKSRFVEELIWKKQKALKQLDAGSITHSFFDIKTTSKEIEIAKRQLHISFLEKFSFSASSVDTYLRCPLRFYYQSVLGLKETEAFLEEPEASDVGTFIHHVCEEAFKQFVGKPPCIDTAFKKYFFNVLDDKFEKEFVRKMKSDAFLMKEVIDLRLSRFLEHEARREVKTLECVEKVFEDTIRSGAKDYRFKAKIDRIDRLSDESLLIIDYKTGSSDIMPSVSRLIQEGCVSRQALKKSVKSFQLPLYYYLVSRTEKDVKMNAVLYNIRDPKGFEAGRLFKNEETLSQRKEILDIFMEALGFILKEITDRDVPFRADEEDSRYCQNCSFFYLCR